MTAGHSARAESAAVRNCDGDELQSLKGWRESNRDLLGDALEVADS
jgi:hypothetical protein